MNSQTPLNPFFRCGRLIAALFAGIFLTSAVPAQPMAGGADSRYLLIFDTSSGMKKRVPATQYAVERLFLSMMNGQLQPGDTVGAWAFDRKLRAGDFPLQHWMSQDAALIASNITNYVIRQRYSKSTRFDEVMPEVNNLVRNSERLTVLIFCDGDGEIKGTPVDDAINTIFKQNRSELGKADQTFIVVLRSQFGQYIGYTVNSSAVGVNFPGFPPLPAPPPPLTPASSHPSPPPLPPVIKTTPLVIVGTNVSTNLIPLTPPKVVLPNPPATKVESNQPPPVESLSSPTNATRTNATPPKIAETQTNAPAPSEENSGLSRKGALAIGAGLLVAACLLVILALLRSRKASRGSLITRAMKKN
jgi:hypothetical protein